jgi:ubiquinone/menaquinone biosynthesis C-methylase UbiE
VILILAIKIIFLIIASIVGLFILYQIIIRILRRFIHFPAPAVIGRFLDSDLRRKLQSPDVIIKRSGIEKNMKILEIGCGSGAFTTYVARVVGKQGEIYALDIQQEMLDQLNKKLKDHRNSDITNIKLINASAYKLPFQNNTFDLIYMISVFQEIPNGAKSLAEVKRVLKPRGILAISEFFIDPDYPLRSTTIKQGEQSGFKFDSVSGNFWNYTIKFRNP